MQMRCSSWLPSCSRYFWRAPDLASAPFLKSSPQSDLTFDFCTTKSGLPHGQDLLLTSHHELRALATLSPQKPDTFARKLDRRKMANHHLGSGQEQIINISGKSWNVPNSYVHVQHEARRWELIPLKYEVFILQPNQVSPFAFIENR